MKQKVKKIFLKFSWLFDIVMLPFVVISAIILKILRKGGIMNSPLSKKALFSVGTYPILNHYYEPMLYAEQLRKPLSDERILPAIDWNIDEQLTILKTFKFQHEFEKFPAKFVNDTTFHFENASFESGDAEYWYNLIRLKKPRRIIEIGSGHSTKMARLAIQANTADHASYQCEHICIEPYEMPWLEKIGVEVLRKKVEDIQIDFFQRLETDDILFVDSSHMIRPQGDVLFEFLELIPTLKSGVIVHVHDIFSPRDYPKGWIIDDVRFWNEQYLLEAFLSFNKEWRIIGAVNFLCHNHFDLVKEKCPRLTPNREPGSFYIIKN